MKRKSLILFVFATFATIASAQLDTWMMYQELNRINAEYYQQQQQLFNQLGEILQQESKRQKEQASASCLMIPAEGDMFFAYITLLYLGKNDIEIISETSSGNRKKIPMSSCFYGNGKIITPAVFAPGSKVYVQRKANGKKLSIVRIPSKSSANYSSFVKNGLAIAGSLAGQLNNSPIQSGGYSGSSSSKKKCSYCGGRGWNPGNKTPTYGNMGTKWCSECNANFPLSHSHDLCPSCRGRGYTGY